MGTTLTIYLQPGESKRFGDGRFRFPRLLAEATEKLGYQVKAVDYDALQAIGSDGPSLWHQMQPRAPGGLVFRTAFKPPFWRIERHAERWRWEIAHAEFDETGVDKDAAARFCQRLRDELRIERQERSADKIVIALQGDLLRKRSFQSVSPVEMVKKTIARCPDTPIIAALHPRASYTASEISWIDELANRTHNLTIERRGASAHVAQAQRFVTQNSTSALAALLAGVPVELHAKSDFHHAETVNRKTAPEGAAYGFDRYVFWFLTTLSIRAGKNDVKDQIVQRLESLGL